MIDVKSELILEVLHEEIIEIIKNQKKIIDYIKEKDNIEGDVKNENINSK